MDGNQQPVAPNGQNTPWQFTPGDTPVQQPAPIAAAPSSSPVPQFTDDAIEWTASEFIAHDKSAGWYMLLAAGTFVVATITFLLIRDVMTVIVIVVCAIAFGIMGARKPRDQVFRLDHRGLTVGARHYEYKDFHSYSFVIDNAIPTLEFTPTKRFALLTTIHYDPADHDAIATMLGDHLPMEERSGAAIDRLMWRIRF